MRLESTSLDRAALGAVGNATVSIFFELYAENDSANNNVIHRHAKCLIKCLPSSCSHRSAQFACFTANPSAAGVPLFRNSDKFMVVPLPFPFFFPPAKVDKLAFTLVMVLKNEHSRGRQRIAANKKRLFQNHSQEKSAYFHKNA